MARYHVTDICYIEPPWHQKDLPDEQFEAAWLEKSLFHAHCKIVVEHARRVSAYVRWNLHDHYGKPCPDKPCEQPTCYCNDDDNELWYLID